MHMGCSFMKQGHGKGIKTKASRTNSPQPRRRLVSVMVRSSPATCSRDTGLDGSQEGSASARGQRDSAKLETEIHILLLSRSSALNETLGKSLHRPWDRGTWPLGNAWYSVEMTKRLVVTLCPFLGKDKTTQPFGSRV